MKGVFEDNRNNWYHLTLWINTRTCCVLIWQTLNSCVSLPDYMESYMCSVFWFKEKFLKFSNKCNITIIYGLVDKCKKYLS